MAKPCTPHPIAQRVQLFELLTCNGGVEGEGPSSFSGGSKGGILFEKRMPPFSALPHGAGVFPPRSARHITPMQRVITAKLFNQFLKEF